MLKYLPDLSCTLQPSTLHHSFQTASQWSISLPFLAAQSSMCNICPTKWPTRGVQALLSICSERFAEISSSRKAKALWKILVSVTVQSLSHRVAIFLSQVFRKHQSCSAHVLQMVCAQKHMAFIVYIHTICPVYRPKAPGNAAHITRAPEQIWARAENASEILTLLEQSLKSWTEVMNSLKYCRGRKCMFSVYNSSKNSFSLGMKDLTVLPAL